MTIRKDLKWKKNGEGFEFYDGESSVDLEDWYEKVNQESLPSHVLESKNPVIRWEERRRRQRIVNLILKSNPHEVIADVGCADGFLSKQLIPYCSKVYCIDLDTNMLELAKKKIASKKAEFIQSNAENIELPDNSVDVSFATHLLEHLPSPRKGLKELCRITKPGGSIILNLPNEKAVLFLKNVIKKLKLNFILGGEFSTELAPGHLHVFDKKLLQNTAKGISIINELSYNPPLYTFMYARLIPMKKELK